MMDKIDLLLKTSNETNEYNAKYLNELCENNPEVKRFLDCIHSGTTTGEWLRTLMYDVGGSDQAGYFWMYGATSSTTLSRYTSFFQKWVAGDVKYHLMLTEGKNSPVHYYVRQQGWGDGEIHTSLDELIKAAQFNTEHYPQYIART
jgi:hypothetical protein